MSKTTPEQRLTQQIMLYCGQHNMLCFHVNVGGGLLANGNYFTTGLPKGFPDLHIIGDGFVLYCETKIHPRKPTAEQLRIIKLLNEKNIVAGVVYNLNEFIELLKKVKK